MRVEAFRCLTECSGSSRVTARPFELVLSESVTVRLRQESRVSSSGVLRVGKSQVRVRSPDRVRCRGLSQGRSDSACASFSCLWGL